MEYEVDIAELPKIRLVGIYANANFSDVPDVCHRLWEQFIPRLEEIHGIAGRRSFGVSANMREDGGFDYWAAVETLTDHIP
jgi:predicted transcriptional regulator YdeE